MSNNVWATTVIKGSKKRFNFMQILYALWQWSRRKQVEQHERTQKFQQQCFMSDCIHLIASVTLGVNV